MQKKHAKKSRFALGLLSVLLCAGAIAIPVSAADNAATEPEITMTTDKTEYTGTEKIQETVTIKNTTAGLLTDVVVKGNIPEGYVTSDDKGVTNQWTAKLSEVTVGNTSEVNVTLVKKAEGTQASTENSSVDDSTKLTTPTTGDNVKTGVCVCVALVCIAGSIVLLKKKGTKVLSFVLIVSMVGSVACISGPAVNAEEAVNLVEKTAVVSREVTVDGKKVTLEVAVTYQVEEKAEEEVSGDPTSPYGTYGDLQLLNVDHDGDASTPARKQLCDEDGNPVQLKGMSTFGLQWSDGYWVLNESAFDALAYDWDCDIIRLAMYVEEGGYASDPKVILDRVEKGIELATARGMYVIVDWHMLSPGDPTSDVYLNAGMELAEEGQPFYEIAQEHPDYNGPQLFFAYISEKYGDQGNVLFELANEPNQLGTEANANDVWSNKLKPYFEDVLAAVRDNDADDVDNIVICGTDNWSQFVNAPASDPIDDDSVMYTVHFYAGTHDAGYDDAEQYWLRAKIDEALDKGLAVFCTEWGTSESTGDGGPYIDFSERWLDYFEENQISWCSWSLAKKDEISASCTSRTLSEPTDLDGDGIPEWDSTTLSISGNYVRAKIRGEEAPLYTESTMALDFESGIGMCGINGDSPNKDIDMEAATVETTALKVTNATGGGIWNNRISFNDLGTTYGIYRDLTFELIVKDEDVENASITIKPIIQSNGTGWWGDAISEQTFTKDNFTSLGNGYSVCKATFPLEALNPAPADALGHILLLLDTTTCESIYIDNVGFSSCTNGDIKYKAKLPDNPGTYVSMPFTFESGTREGWVTEGTSKLDYEDFTVGLAETTALKFPVGFDGTNNEWEDGARISTPHFPNGELPIEKCKNIKTIEFDVYLEPEHATMGELAVHVCPIPNGAGYWYEAGAAKMDPVNGGEVITNSEGTTLLKYHVVVPFSTDGNYPYSEDVPVRNLVLAFASDGSDYNGYIYCDNVEFVE